MAFEGLTQRLQQAFGKMRGKGKLTEEDVKLVMREVRMALLEADVNYKVVKDFVKKATERCVGQELIESLNAQQQIIKIVNEELTALMGGTNARLQYSSSPVSVFMLCGLQGFNNFFCIIAAVSDTQIGADCFRLNKSVIHESSP